MSNEDYTVGEFEEMDLRELKDKTFMVAISQGPRDKYGFVPQSICGPFDFYEMVETVGSVYEQHMLNAKAFIPNKSIEEPPQMLDENTIDFIEARYMDILAEGLLDGGLTEEDYTCKAGFIPAPEEEDADQQSEG